MKLIVGETKSMFSESQKFIVTQFHDNSTFLLVGY